MELEGRGIFFSELTKYDAVDFNNKKLGHVGDLLIDKQTFATKGLIIHGSFFEEKMEAIGLKENVDPIIPIDLVDFSRFHEKVIASVKAKHQLPSTSNDYKPPEDVFMFSNLKNFQILDENNIPVGHLVDLCFHSDGKKTLVINPGRHLHVGDTHRYLQSREVMVPGKFIKEITLNELKLTISKEKFDHYEGIGLHRFIDKDIKALDKGLDEIGSRFHYNVYSAPMKIVAKQLAKRKEKVTRSLKNLNIQKYNPSDDTQTKQLVTIFNEVAMTSPDPYEELSPEVAKKYFGKGTFLVYHGNKIVGYNILSWKETEEGKIGSIAGVGLHHNQRGKGYATAIINDAIEFFKNEGGFTHVEADVLVTNEPSSKLFEGLGFEKISDFYLS